MGRVTRSARDQALAENLLIEAQIISDDVRVRRLIRQACQLLNGLPPDAPSNVVSLTENGRLRRGA